MTYLQKAQVLYMAKNDAKKSKNLSKTIDNLSTEIDKYKASNEQSTQSMKALENQLAEYRAASDVEKENLRKQIVQLEQSRYTVVQGGGGGGGDKPRWVRTYFYFIEFDLYVTIFFSMRGFWEELLGLHL